MEPEELLKITKPMDNFLGEPVSIKLTKPEIVRTLVFLGKEGKQIGKFYWENELRFEGNAEESAKVFIKWLKELWNL